MVSFQWKKVAQNLKNGELKMELVKCRALPAVRLLSPPLLLKVKKAEESRTGWPPFVFLVPKIELEGSGTENVAAALTQNTAPGVISPGLWLFEIDQTSDAPSSPIRLMGPYLTTTPPPTTTTTSTTTETDPTTTTTLTCPTTESVSPPSTVSCPAVNCNCNCYWPTADAGSDQSTVAITQVSPTGQIGVSEISGSSVTNAATETTTST